MTAAKKKQDDDRLTVALNKKARHEFQILESLEAGIVLQGTEVKSLRQKLVSLDEAFGRIYGNEIFLVGARIEPYAHARTGNHEPVRKRKLLLRRLEIRRLKAKVTQKGLTLVPLELFFSSRGHAKVLLALCKGKQTHDKRQDLRKKDDRREMRRVR